MITKEEIKINEIGPKRGSKSEEPNNADNNHHDAADISKKVANNAIGIASAIKIMAYWFTELINLKASFLLVNSVPPEKGLYKSS